MIKVGFIGAGDISLLHAEGVVSAENAELTGIWNRTHEKATEKSKLFQCKVFKTVEELIQAVETAVPNGSSGLKNRAGHVIKNLFKHQLN